MGPAEQPRVHDALLTMRVTLFISLLFIAVGLGAAEVSYQRDVWPIFKRHCIGCHSAQKTKGKLRLDDPKLLRSTGEDPLFVPGKPEVSMLIKQIIGDEPEMPQNEPPLSAAKVNLLRDWVLQGAKIDATPANSVPAVVIPKAYTSAPAVTSVTISTDGKLAAAACRSEVVLFKVEGNDAPRRVPTEFDLITHVELSPDGKLLAIAGGSPQQFGGVMFVNPADGKTLSVRRLGGDTFFRGNFAPDSKTIALGAANGAVFLIPVDASAPPKSIELHSDWVMDVAFTADGKQLVSGGRDKTIKVSSVAGLKLLRSIDQSPEMITSVAADPLNAIAAGDARVLKGYDFKIALSGVEVSGAGNGSRPVNKLTQYVRTYEGQSDKVTDLALSGDRKLLAVATRSAEIRLYQTTDRKRKTAITKVPAPVFSIALNGDGSRLILGSKSGEVQIYDTASSKLLKTIVPVPVLAKK